jgi:predicted dithiol-disulfide oxidoreductase (DUF899 family)
MSLPEVVSREDWLAARTALLDREKELTRLSDAVNADRRRLPMVRVDKPYVFEGDHGQVGLIDLFEGSRQLIIYHAMFDPAWDAACPSCSAGMNEAAPGLLANLKDRDTSYVRVSRAPYAKIMTTKRARGWTFPWYSSFGSDFNVDYGVTVDPDRSPEYNYRPLPVDRPTELPGFSCFLRDGDIVFHTYSTYARGTEPHGGTYRLLDLTALGRQEPWEQPAGRMEAL